MAVVAPKVVGSRSQGLVCLVVEFGGMCGVVLVNERGASDSHILARRFANRWRG
jgi:hypothetical protein